MYIYIYICVYYYNKYITAIFIFIAAVIYIYICMYYIGGSAYLSSPGLSNGDLLTVIREGAKISFEKNGVSLGVAWTDVPSDLVLYPYIDIYSKGAAVTFIQELKWNTLKKSSALTVSTDGLKAYKSSGGDAWNCSVLGDNPCNRYSVKYDAKGANGDIMIGFSSLKDMDVGISNYTKKGSWALYCNGGTLYSGSGDSAKSYLGVSPSVGEVITVVRDGTKINFERNGVSCGVAFSDIPTDAILYPYLDIYSKDASLTIIPNYASKKVEIKDLAKCSFDIDSYKSTKSTITNGGYTITKNDGTGEAWNCCGIGTLACNRFSVRLDNLGNCFYFFFLKRIYIKKICGVSKKYTNQTQLISIYIYYCV